MLSLLDPKFSPSAPQDFEDDKGKASKVFDSQHHASKSNSLRRLMGLDSGTGIMTVVQRTRTFSDLGSVFKSKPLNSLPGLGNWDHSCYQNSVIQGLASLKSLPGFLRPDETEDEQRKREEGPTRKALRELTERLNDEENVGKTFWTPSELKSMSSWQQQDAQEYFSKIMDGLEKDAARAKKMGARQVGFETLSMRDNETEEKVIPKIRESTLQTSRISQLPEELQAIMVKNPLEGLLAQRVGCQQCGYVEGLSLVPFNCLTVPLGRKWMYDIRECLDEYTALEPINGVECAKCTLLRAKTQMDQMLKQLSDKRPLEGKDDYNAQLGSLREDAQKRLDLVDRALEDEDFSDSALKKCQIPAKSYVSATKSRQAVVARPPKALVIHINRSIFDELTGEQSKNQASVRFPKRFNLGFWCLGTEEETPGETPIENWNTDPRQSMLENVVDSQNLEIGPAYELRAVVTHYGRHENGHYICYRRSPYTVKMEGNAAVGSTERSELWWRLSDEEVTEVNEESVLAQGGVFMLFYEQVPSRGRVLPLFLEQAPDETSVVNAEQVETVTHEIPDNIRPAAIDLEPEDGFLVEAPIPSVYPTLPPEDFKGLTEKPDSRSSSQDRLTPTGEANPPSMGSMPVEYVAGDPFLSPKDLSPPTNKDTNQAPTKELQQLETPAVAQPASSSPVPKPISPRTGREKGRRTGKAMESMAGFVQAN